MFTYFVNINKTIIFVSDNNIKINVLAVWQDYSEWGGVYEYGFWDIN